MAQTSGRLRHLHSAPDMQPPQAHLLEDGQRLHLHHGPIDLIIEAFGSGQQDAYQRATERFQTILAELATELVLLRKGADATRKFEGSTARRMQEAVLPLLPNFITPMAAVAGAVADEILSSMVKGCSAEELPRKIYVNNGGDTAFRLSANEHISAAIANRGAGKIVINADTPFRGIASSGWRGRSHSFGIADTVSVVATNAAVADAAATMIANAVDLPDHPLIKRTPAIELFPDSDLGNRLVTTEVAELSYDECAQALAAGGSYASSLLDRNIIGGAMLMLGNQTKYIGSEIFHIEGT